jgi:hypothetical protein
MFAYAHKDAMYTVYQYGVVCIRYDELLRTYTKSCICKYTFLENLNDVKE